MQNHTRGVFPGSICEISVLMNRLRQKFGSFGAQKCEGVEVASGTYDFEEFFNIRVVKAKGNMWGEVGFAHFSFAPYV